MNDDFPDEPDDLSKYVFAVISALIATIIVSLLFSDNFVKVLKSRTNRPNIIRNGIVCVILLLLNLLLIV